MLPTRILLGLMFGSLGLARAAPSAPERARRLGASPNQPRFALEYRGAARGTLGAELPVVGRRSRDEWALALVPLVELHNEPHPDSWLPNEFWRARLGAEGWWSPRRQGSPSVELGLAFEHESDHSTARVDSRWGFATLNDLALKQLIQLELGPLALGLAEEVDLYLWSCTRRPELCTSFGGTTSVGGALGLVADGWRWQLWGWRPFVALDGSGIWGRGLITPEARIVAHAGTWRAGPVGLWELYWVGFFGNDVGVHRRETVRQLGVGFAWSPP